MRSKAVLLTLGMALAFSLGATPGSATDRPAAGGGGAADLVIRVKLCLNGGWRHLTRSDARPFRSEVDCVLYAALGGKFGQSLSFTSANPSPASVGDFYTPTATATSALPVTITLDASSTGCTLSSGVILFTAAGTCRIDADQAGNGIWAAAPQAHQAITVNVPDLVLLSGSLSSTGTDGVKNYVGAIPSTPATQFSIVNLGSGSSQMLLLQSSGSGYAVIGDTCSGTRLAAHGGTCSFSLLFFGICASPQTFPISVDVYGVPLQTHYIDLLWLELCTPTP